VQRNAPQAFAGTLLGLSVVAVVMTVSLVPFTLRRRYTIERLLLQDDGSDLYLARPRSGAGEPVTLRIYHPGLRLDERILPPVPGVLESDPGAAGRVAWLVQEYVPGGTLGALLNGQPWMPERALEAVSAVVACAAEWRAATGRPLGAFHPDDLLVRGFGPLVLRVGHVPALNSYGRSRPAPPEAVRGEDGDPATWWALGVVARELGVPGGRWDALRAGLLTHDDTERWDADDVAAWLDGRDPAVPESRSYGPLTVAGRPHATPADLAVDLAARPGPAEAWLAEGGDVLLANWLDLEVHDRRFDRDLLAEPPAVLVAAFAAAFTGGVRPRYRGFAVDAEGLTDLARGGAAGHLVLAEALAAGVLPYAARHRCAHPECGTGCVQLGRVDAEVPIILDEVRTVLDRMRDVAGRIPERDWNGGVAAAVELTLDPLAVRRHRRRLRLIGLSTLRRGGPSWVGWWREQRDNALSGRREEIATRAAIVSALLLTAGADAAGRQLAEENKDKLREHGAHAAGQLREVVDQTRLRGPGVVRDAVLALADRGEETVTWLRKTWLRIRVRLDGRYARLLLDRAERRTQSSGSSAGSPASSAPPAPWARRR
jgi:hypothetical protein